LVTSILAHFGEKPGFHLKYFTLATCCSVLSFYHFQFWGYPAVSFMLRFGIPQLFSTTVQELDIPRNVSYILRPSTERSPFLAGFPHFPWLKVPLPGGNPSVFSWYNSPTPWTPWAQIKILEEKVERHEGAKQH
jgi:hypothetical protein